MKLTEYKGEEALDLLADIIEPTVTIFSDEEVKKAFNGENKLGIVKIAIKNHKKELIEIMARMDNVPVDEYEVNLFTLPIKVTEIINDRDLLSFFKSQYQISDENASSSATENIEEAEQE